MRTGQRLRGIREFLIKEICGKPMKRPTDKALDVEWVKPDVYIGYYPDYMEIDSLSPRTAPAVLIIPKLMKANTVNDHRFDRYNNIVRSDEAEAELTVQIVLVLWDPGERTRIAEMTQDPMQIESNSDGLMRMIDWLDELSAALNGTKYIPETDLMPRKETILYQPLMEMDRIVDKRPLYFGILECSFFGMVNEKPNESIKDLLR